MREEKITIQYTVFKSVDELNTTEKELVNKAIEATENAYAPYSKFNVGAAILLENEKIITGSNQENAASPVTCCAERTALFYTGANYPNEVIKSIAVAAKSEKMNIDDALSPCGMCRQALFEYEKKQGKPIHILLFQPNGKIWKFNAVSELLPFSFWVDLA